MGLPAIQQHKEAQAWTRTKEKGAETKRFDVEKLKDVSNNPRKRRPASYKVTSREPHQALPETLKPAARRTPPAVHLSSTSKTSAASSNSRERPYPRGIPEGSVVSYTAYPLSTISETPGHATTRLNLTTSSHTPSVTHSTHSTYRSHGSTNSVTQPSLLGENHPHSLKAVPIPSSNTTSSHAQSAVSIAQRTASENYLPSSVSGDSSRAPRAAGVAPSHVSKIYPPLPPSRDSSCAAQSRVPESTTPASESRLLTCRAPSVVTVTPITTSDQNPLFPASNASSVISSLQPSRSRSVASIARSALIKDNYPLPISVSRSPSIAPSIFSISKESLQESRSRDPSRAPSSRTLSSRASPSQAPSSRTASVAPSSRSECAVTTPSAAQRRADEEYARPEAGSSLRAAESSATSRRPSVIQHTEQHAAPVSERAPNIAASIKSSVKSGRNERDISIASIARSHMRGEDFEPSIQSKSTSKRASSIKPPSRSVRGDSTAPKARSYIEMDDHESSIERDSTSKRALSRTSSSKSARKASRDGRGRSTTSRTESAHDELAEVKVTYDEHEGAGTKNRPRSERSKSASTRRSSSVSSTETIRALRAGEHNAMIAYHDNALHTAKVSEYDIRRKSSRPRKSPVMSVISVSTSGGLDVMHPDASDDEVKQTSGKKSQRSHHHHERQQYQQQQKHQPQYSQPHQQPYPQPYPPQYTQPYHQQPQCFQQQPQTAYGVFGYPSVHPQYTNHQYTNQQYPNPRYTHRQSTAQPDYSTVNAPYPSQYVAPEPQYATAYANLGEELKQGRKSGRLPKARDRRPEKVERSERRTHREEEYEKPPLIHELRYDEGEFPPGWFDT